MAQEIVTSPLPGKVLSVTAKAGAQISEGDEICVIEAMKMENPIVATVSGKVTEVSVSDGQALKAGDPIATIEY